MNEFLSKIGGYVVTSLGGGGSRDITGGSRDITGGSRHLVLGGYVTGGGSLPVLPLTPYTFHVHINPHSILLIS